MSYSALDWVTEQVALAVPLVAVRVALREDVDVFSVTFILPLA